MINFDEYIRQGEPQKREKGYAWQTATGLQAVDGGLSKSLLHKQIDEVLQRQGLGDNGDLPLHFRRGPDGHGHQPVDGKQSDCQQHRAADGLSHRSHALFRFHILSSLCFRGASPPRDDPLFSLRSLRRTGAPAAPWEPR